MRTDGWNIRSIYEDKESDLLEAEAFYIAFARIHNLDGHHILSVLTPVKRAKANSEGILTNNTVLIVKDSDMEGITLNTSIRVDGKLYVISAVTRPCGDIVRIELEGNE